MMRRRQGDQEGYGLDEQLTDQLVPTMGSGAERNGGWQTMGGGYDRAQRAMQEDGVSPEAQAGALAGLRALGTEPSVSRETTMREDRSNTGLAGKAPNINAVPATGSTSMPGAAPVGSPEGLSRGGLADAARRAQANNYTDIEGTQNFRTGDFMGSLEGFNTGAWGSGERGSHTLKNSFGRIASRYDPTQPGAAKTLMQDEDFRATWPDAVLIDHPNGDLIDFDGPGGDPPVDVLRAAQAGGAGQAWQWGVQDGGGGAAGANAGGGGLGQGVTVNSLMSGDPMAAITEQINGLTGGQDSQIQALIEQILSGQQPQV